MLHGVGGEEEEEEETGRELAEMWGRVRGGARGEEKEDVGEVQGQTQRREKKEGMFSFDIILDFLFLLSAAAARGRRITTTNNSRSVAISCSFLQSHTPHHRSRGGGEKGQAFEFPPPPTSPTTSNFSVLVFSSTFELKIRDHRLRPVRAPP